MSKRFQILICDGPSCGVMHESELLKEQVARALEGDADLGARVTLCDYTCFGRCEDGPNMFVRELGEGEDEHDEPDPDVFERQRGFYPGQTADKMLRIVREHCTSGDPVDELVDDY